ncbi:hypothetical protein [Ktedonospora formicarum]|uniref:Uncharacterized protein n=1 Tax=Ktedonospora formicarum TaxID=2778364 RepID=A0A8J3I301_9CHLR|nr:hypothetical protein [Ktedonospora formicarum]GHO45773.1 hypothetical protein KSX_39360 [Ktedonospora formicarum]
MQSTETAHLLFSPCEVIGALIQQLGEKYVFPEKAQEMVSALHQRLYRGTYDDIDDGSFLALTLASHLQAVSHYKYLRLYC